MKKSAARLTTIASTLLLGLGAASTAQAQEKFTYMTNWYAQAEHGGFYQALAMRNPGGSPRGS